MAGLQVAGSDDLWLYRQRRLAYRLLERAIQSDDIVGESKEELVIRPILPGLDLDSGTENGWSTDQEWRQDWNASGSADAWNDSYRLDHNARMENKIVGFYGVEAYHSDIDTRQIRFRRGLDSNIGTRMTVNIENVVNDQESRGLLSRDLVYGTREDGHISHWIDAADDNNRIAYHGYIAETVEETINEPEFPMIWVPSSGTPGYDLTTGQSGTVKPRQGQQTQMANRGASNQAIR